MRAPVKSRLRRSDAPETMQSPETSDETADAAPAVLVVDELRRRRELGIGPDRPVAVVEVELGRRCR